LWCGNFKWTSRLGASLKRSWWIAVKRLLHKAPSRAPVRYAFTRRKKDLSIVISHDQRQRRYIAQGILGDGLA